MARRRPSSALDGEGFAHCGRKLAKGERLAVDAGADGFTESEGGSKAGLTRGAQMRKQNGFVAVKVGHGLGRPDRRSLSISHPSAIFFSGIGSGGVSIVSGPRLRVRESRFFHFTEFQLPAGQALAKCPHFKQTRWNYRNYRGVLETEVKLGTGPVQLMVKPCYQ